MWVSVWVKQLSGRERGAHLRQRQAKPLRSVPLIGDTGHFFNKAFLFRRGARPSHTIFAAQLKEYLIKTFFLRILAAIAKYAYMYDVLNNESIAAMINKVAEDLGGIYGLVNHCPGPKAGTFEALTEADWADGYQKCLYSYTTAICAALPYMKKGGSGRIVNSTSSSIKQELDNLILSNTFRMGVVGMSKTMAREFGPYNIMVNTMGPGRIYTDRIKYLNTIRAEKAGITLEEYNTRDAASFPQKRYQTADEYARSVVFICSPANSAISGQVICVDGAMTTAY